MRILVTGCAGFIGSHLSESLLAAGHTVVGVDALTEYYDPALKIKNLERCLEYDRFRFERCFINGLGPGTVNDAEVIFHLAAEPGDSNSWGAEFGTCLNLNVLSTQRLLECVRGSKNLKRLVNASCSSVYGNTPAGKTREDHPKAPHSPHGVTKLAAEQLCSLYGANLGIPVISLRLFTVFGPRQRPDMLFSSLISAALRGRAFVVYGDGSAERDFTSVLDVVDALTLAAGAAIETGVFNIAGEQVLSVSEAIAMVEDLLGKRVTIERRSAKPGAIRHGAADISAARQQLGYSPRRSLAEVLMAQVEFIESQLARHSSASGA